MLSEMTIRQLKKLASAEKIKGYSHFTKAQLVASLSYLDTTPCSITEEEAPPKHHPASTGTASPMAGPFRDEGVVPLTLSQSEVIPTWVVAIATVLVVLGLVWKGVVGLSQPLAGFALDALSRTWAMLRQRLRQYWLEWQSVNLNYWRHYH